MVRVFSSTGFGVSVCVDDVEFWSYKNMFFSCCWLNNFVEIGFGCIKLDAENGF